MCVNQRHIINSYDGRDYFVKCGHCEACRQEKANRRVTRIRNEQLSKSFALFVLLSYDSAHVPFIDLDELHDFLVNPGYRVLNVYNLVQVNPLITFTYDDFKTTEFPDFNSYSYNFKVLSSKYPYYRKLLDNKVGVCIQRDAQLFFKRFERNLFRKGYKREYSYFYCLDYGGKNQRPHIHFLLFCNPLYQDIVRNAIIESWEGCDLRKPRRQPDGSYRNSIEIARDAANYVASYVNCTTLIPSFLSESKPFKFRYRFSNGFGCNLQDFTLSEVEKKIFFRDLRYGVRHLKEGVLTEEFLQLPKYVISRYFPKFKGYRHLSSDEVFDVACDAFRLFRYADKAGLTYDECREIINHLNSIKRRFVPTTLGGFLDYATCYSQVWSIYGSYSIKRSFEDLIYVDDLKEHYNNIDDYVYGRVKSFFLDDLDFTYTEIDANNFRRNRAQHAFLTNKFYSFIKHHQINSFYYEKEDF